MPFRVAAVWIVPFCACYLISSTGCAPRIEFAGPGTEPIAYAYHKNSIQELSGRIGGGIGSVLAFSTTIASIPASILYSNANHWDEGSIQNGFVSGIANLTGAVTWPLFGWWYIDANAGR